MKSTLTLIKCEEERRRVPRNIIPRAQKLPRNSPVVRARWPTGGTVAIRILPCFFYKISFSLLSPSVFYSTKWSLSESFRIIRCMWGTRGMTPACSNCPTNSPSSINPPHHPYRRIALSLVIIIKGTPQQEDSSLFIFLVGFSK